MLKKYSCPVLDLQESLDRLYRGALPERAVVLTFDDGFYDFQKVVWPILKEYGYPATVYCTTYWATIARPVVPPIWNYLLWKGRGSVYRSLPDLASGFQLNLTSGAGLSMAMKSLISFADEKNLDGFQRDAITQQLANTVGVDYEEIRRQRLLHLLQPEELCELSRQGVSIQLHMHRHFSPNEEQNFKRNLEENRTYIENLTGSRPTHFCYPGGRYKPDFLPWLSDLGIESATTCNPRLASTKSKPLMLPRLVDTSTLSNIEFESWLVGIGDFVPQLRNNHILEAVAEETPKP